MVLGSCTAEYVHARGLRALVSNVCALAQFDGGIRVVDMRVKQNVNSIASLHNGEVLSLSKTRCARPWLSIRWRHAHSSVMQ
jgi:hypothetical protein